MYFLRNWLLSKTKYISKHEAETDFFSFQWEDSSSSDSYYTYKYFYLHNVMPVVAAFNLKAKMLTQKHILAQ